MGEFFGRPLRILKLESFLSHQKLDGIALHMTGEAVEDALAEVHGGRGSAVVVERAADLLVAVLVAAVLHAVLVEDTFDRDRHRRSPLRAFLALARSSRVGRTFSFSAHHFSMAWHRPKSTRLGMSIRYLGAFNSVYSSSSREVIGR